MQISRYLSSFFSLEKIPDLKAYSILKNCKCTYIAYKVILKNGFWKTVLLIRKEFLDTANLGLVNKNQLIIRESTHSLLSTMLLRRIILVKDVFRDIYLSRTRRHSVL